MCHYHKFFKNDMQMYLNIRALSLSIAAFVLLASSLRPSAYSKEAKEKLSVGERFHHNTSLTWRGVVSDIFRSKPKNPPQYKNYPDSKIIKLPKPACHGITLEESIEKRRSVRNYSGKLLTLSQLSQLLFSAHGITGKLYDQPLRTTPSAGALYPIEIYVIANSVGAFLDEEVNKLIGVDGQTEAVIYLHVVGTL